MKVHLHLLLITGILLISSCEKQIVVTKISSKDTPAEHADTPKMTRETFTEQFKIVQEEQAKKETTSAPLLIPLDDRHGWMKNPYDPDGPLIDVRGIPSGTLIRDFEKNQSYRIPQDYPATHKHPLN